MLEYHSSQDINNYMSSSKKKKKKELINKIYNQSITLKKSLMTSVKFLIVVLLMFKKRSTLYFNLV